MKKILSASDKIIQLENEIFDKLTSFILNYIKDIQENSKLLQNLMLLLLTQ